MKTILIAMSMLTLSCSAAVGLPEGDVNVDDTATPTSPAPASQGSADAANVVVQSPGTAEQCRACHGDWGVHGIAETESCNCGTTDAGKRCTDGSDCQGMCVANADSPEYDVVDVGPPARGLLVGRCSDFVTVFGCNALIDPGARDQGPVSVVEPPRVLCVD